MLHTPTSYNFSIASEGAPFPQVGPGGLVYVNPGPVTITITIKVNPTTTITNIDVVDLLPGQNYAHNYNIY